MIVEITSIVIIVLFLIYLFFSGNVYKILVGKSPNDLGTLLCDSSFLADKSKGSPDDVWCAINFTTGKKRCPTNNEPIYADLNRELCTSKYRCDLQTLPFAVTSKDQSTNIQGNCDAGDPCRCVGKPQCADNILSLFVLQNGNSYLPPDTQTLSFGQTNTYTTKIGSSNSIPIIYTDPTTQYCTINQDLYQNISSGACAGTLDDCIKLNPCIAGTLQQVGTNQIGCVIPSTSSTTSVSSPS